MKLRQLPHESSVGVKFKFSDEYSLPFHMGAPPDFQMSNGKWRSDGVMEWWSEGVMEWNRPITTTWKIIFQVKKDVSVTWRRLLVRSPASTLFFPLPFPFLAKLSNPPSTRCTWRYLSLVLTENVLAVSCCLATLGIRLMACRKFLKVSRSSLICLPLVGTLTISLNRTCCSGDSGLEIEPGELRNNDVREKIKKEVWHSEKRSEEQRRLTKIYIQSQAEWFLMFKIQAEYLKAVDRFPTF